MHVSTKQGICPAIKSASIYPKTIIGGSFLTYIKEGQLYTKLKTVLVVVVVIVLWVWLLAASALGLCVQHSLSQLNIWKDPFSSVKDSFQAGQGLCERWCETCSTLTSFWKRYSPHPWKGSQYIPESLNQFARRLDEVWIYIATLICVVFLFATKLSMFVLLKQHIQFGIVVTTYTIWYCSLHCYITAWILWSG